MNDQAPSPHNEFDIRVRRRLIDPQDEQLDPSTPNRIGLIERVDQEAPTGKMLIAGANVVVIRHPEALKLVRKFVDSMTA